MNTSIRVEDVTPHNLCWWITTILPTLITVLATLYGVFLAHKLGRRQAKEEAATNATAGAVARKDEREHEATLRRDADRRRWLRKKVKHKLHLLETLSELIGTCKRHDDKDFVTRATILAYKTRLQSAILDNRDLVAKLAIECDEVLRFRGATEHVCCADRLKEQAEIVWGEISQDIERLEEQPTDSSATVTADPGEIA
jgi:hypothetical protein